MISSEKKIVWGHFGFDQVYLKFSLVSMFFMSSYSPPQQSDQKILLLIISFCWGDYPRIASMKVYLKQKKYVVNL